MIEWAGGKPGPLSVKSSQENTDLLYMYIVLKPVYNIELILCQSKII